MSNQQETPWENGLRLGRLRWCDILNGWRRWQGHFRHRWLRQLRCAAAKDTQFSKPFNFHKFCWPLLILSYYNRRAATRRKSSSNFAYSKKRRKRSTWTLFWSSWTIALQNLRSSMVPLTLRNSRKSSKRSRPNTRKTSRKKPARW